MCRLGLLHIGTNCSALSKRPAGSYSEVVLHLSGSWCEPLTAVSCVSAVLSIKGCCRSRPSKGGRATGVRVLLVAARSKSQHPNICL